MADLLLDSRAGMLRGGKSGAPAVVPGKPEDSLLIAAVRGANKVLRMPPDKPLEGNEIDNLIEWVKAGAPDPRNELNPQAGLRSAYDWDKARRHWAFGPIQDPRPPRVASAEWSKSPIDQFIKAKLDEKALIPLPGASKLALIRRATYDLSGLPPTRKEVDAFIKDTSAEAFEKVVDRLLGSEQYGERWGRHWLDVVRYADTSGDSSDFPVPEMYRYRNWVIAAFNRDKPYNHFLREQLAGDILAANDKEGSEDWRRKVIAKGYLANSRRFGSLLSEFHLTIDDTIDNLGKGILGLSVSCARCHDHKFDPIPTTDYYALYGIFRSSNYPHPGTEIFPHPYGFVALEGPEQASKLKSFEAELSELDRYLHDVKLGNIKFPDKEHQKNAQTETEDKIRRLTSQYPYFRKAYAVMEGTPGNAPVLIKGDPAMLGPVVPRGFLTLLGGQKVSSEEKGSGRLELADWITDPKNPLTARVIVNRIWTWHFGQGIVATPDDFGTRGARPTHPELLDYLATRFIESGWSIKRMHKLIMLSRTYQMASGNDERNAAKDPENTYLWKFKRRRMDAEEIRDSLLAVSGKLDPAIAGPHPFPPEMGWKFTQHRPFIAVYPHNKRSIYLMQQRIQRHPFLEVFDGADTNGVMGLRPLTTTAPQALYMMNDPFFHEAADALAVRVGMAYSSDVERLRYAYNLLYNRNPEAVEIRDARQFLAGARESLQDSAVPDDEWNRNAWASLMRVLLSSNEFLTLD